MSQTSLPCTLGGGILADEMGLGKTLTMLATIVRSLPEARRQPQMQRVCNDSRIRFQGTLVILPLSRMYSPIIPK